jgi:C-terminal processing protease CtpA/Prc
MLGPSRVGIIVDEGTVSAAEVVVLQALQSTRAKVFGQPTDGALDYSSANVVRVLPDESRWLLGYGTMAWSNKLPVNGMREKGIEPDVRLTIDQLWGAIESVERRLSAG